MSRDEQLKDRWIQGRCKGLEMEQPELSFLERIKVAYARWDEQEWLEARAALALARGGVVMGKSKTVDLVKARAEIERLKDALADTRERLEGSYTQRERLADALETVRKFTGPSWAPSTTMRNKLHRLATQELAESGRRLVRSPFMRGE